MKRSTDVKESPLIKQPTSDRPEFAGKFQSTVNSPAALISQPDA